jgi:hypothetical protein
LAEPDPSQAVGKDRRLRTAARVVNSKISGAS